MLARSGCSLQGFTLLTVTTVSQKFNFFTCINKLSFTKNLESTDENGDFLKKTVNWSTVLRLQCHYWETVYFLLLSPQEFLALVFLSGFLSRVFTIHRIAGEGGGYFFNFSLPLSLDSQTH